MPDKPYTLNTDAQAPAPQSRDIIGRYAREGATPSNPLSEEKPAKNDQEVMSGWAPGIGQNSAEIRKNDNPYPKIADTDSVPAGGFTVK